MKRDDEQKGKTKQRVFWLWCALMFGVGFLAADWVLRNAQTGVGMIASLSDLGAVAVVIVVANAKLFVAMPAILSALKDVKDFFGL